MNDETPIETKQSRRFGPEASAFDLWQPLFRAGAQTMCARINTSGGFTVEQLFLCEVATPNLGTRHGDPLLEALRQHNPALAIQEVRFCD